MEGREEVLFASRPSWRYFYINLAQIIGALIIAVYLATSSFSGFVIMKGWTVRSASLSAWFIFAVAVLANMAARRYDLKYIIDREGIELRKGIISKKITRVRHRDIREVSYSQGIIERMLGVGDVAVACSATDSFEVTMCGVRNPDKVADLIRQAMEEAEKEHQSTEESEKI